jgi:pilus assembly protein CpaE
VNSDSSLFRDDPNPDSLDADILSIALIGPDEDRRKAAASVLSECQAGDIREFSSYPAGLSELPMLLEQHYDVIIIDLDSRPEYALELVESICANSVATVMVYSAKANSESLVKCMRAGAREFLTLPFAQSTVVEALMRASGRRPATSRPAKKNGRLLAFLGAKGGDGVTTLACNFAVSLAQESGQSTLLIDLDLPLGDAALNLGVMAEYSTINALQNAARLDSSFLSKLLVKHSTGVSVLAAPGKFPRFDATNEAIDKLLTVARGEFDNVVIDMGSRLDLMGTEIFKDGSTVYLVIQAGIAGLRNSNRLISQYFSADVPKLEIVLNRFQPRSLGVAEDQITKALTRPAQWKIPNDYAAVRRMQHTAIPLALEDSAISRLIRQMARTACGLPPIQEKGAGFSFKRIGRSFTTKISIADEAPSLTHLNLSSEDDNVRPDNGRAASTFSWPEATASVPVQSVATPSAEPEPEPEAEEAQPLLTAGDTASSDDALETKEEASQGAATPSLTREPRTRFYQGATYVKGEDGQWHLQATQAGDAKDEAPLPEKKSSVIEWLTPDPIIYGVALSASQLNATAAVPGKYVYTPAAGEVLAAGEHTLSVTFTPEDTSRYAEAQSTVLLTVAQAAPIIAWSTPSPIAYGTALGATQLNAIASVPGTFVYQPGEGEVLTPGVQALSVEFTPADAVNYTAGHFTVSLNVTLTTPVISWSTPAPISYGTALSAAQLNATASVAGALAYTPSKGEVLRAGEHTLSVSFTPADGTRYRTAGAAVALVVTKATPIINWPVPASIASGIALSATQLNATALVPGTLIYTPAAGEVLPAGTHTLSVAFTPADTTNYIPMQATVPLTVARATPEIQWPAPGARRFSADSVLRASEFKAASKPAPAPVPAVKPIPQAESALGKAVAKAPGKVSPKTGVKSSAKSPAKQPVKPAAKHPAKAVAQAHTETPANALIKVGNPEAPLEVGPGLDLMGSAVLEDGTTIYLVMQPGSAGVANSNRLVSQFFSGKGRKPNFVINRFEPRSPDVAEGQSSTALTRPAYKPISRLIGQMARPASDTPAAPEKKTGFSLKGFGRSIWSKLAAPERVPSMTQLGLAADQEDANAPLGAAQPDTTANLNERSAYAPHAAKVITSAERRTFSQAAPVGFANAANMHQDGVHAAGSHGHRRGPETRTYRGALYAKGEDGQWHLQKTETEAVKHETRAIPLPASTPDAVSQSAWAETVPVSAKKIVRKTKSVSKNSQAKASTSKKPVKNAVKPASKSSAKRPVKPVAKPAATAPAKRLIKAAAKPALKAPDGRLVNAAAKPLVKAAAKPPVRKPASASKRHVSALTPKPANRVKASNPPVISQALAYEAQEPLREPAPVVPVPELVKEG